MSDTAGNDLPTARTEARPDDAPTQTSVYLQADLRLYITIIGVVLTVFGLVAGLLGHASAVPARPGAPFPSANAADAWMWIGALALVLGLATLLVQLFIHAYRSPPAHR